MIAPLIKGARKDTNLNISYQEPISSPGVGHGLLMAFSSFRPSVRTSTKLDMRASAGAKGKATTNRLRNPNFRQIHMFKRG